MMVLVLAKFEVAFRFSGACDGFTDFDIPPPSYDAHLEVSVGSFTAVSTVDFGDSRCRFKKQL